MSRPDLPCPVCASADPIREFSAYEMMFGTREEFRYGECGHCQLLWLRDPPPDFAPYYPSEYHGREAASSGLRALAARWRNRTALTGRGWIGGRLERRVPNLRLRALRPVAPSRSAAILDVGAGHGAFVHTLRELGFRGAVGVDPYLEDDVALRDGTTLVHSGTLEGMAESFDVLTFHHSFEHVPDPRATLRAAADRLRPNGTIVIRVPVFPSWAFEHYGANWVQLDAPRHLCLHSPTSLALLASGCGLTIVATEWDSTALQFWGSEQYAAGIPLWSEARRSMAPEPGRFSPEEFREFGRRAVELNEQQRGDQANFYLKAAASPSSPAT